MLPRADIFYETNLKKNGGCFEQFSPLFHMLIKLNMLLTVLC